MRVILIVLLYGRFQNPRTSCRKQTTTPAGSKNSLLSNKRLVSPVISSNVFVESPPTATVQIQVLAKN